jgi:ParB family chromosome partitioning protein
VPVSIRTVDAGSTQSLLEMALIENIQREDLNPIEEALAYRRLADEFRFRQEDIATAVGKDRASVANYLRLLKLPEPVQAGVATGRLSMGHARALLGIADESALVRAAEDVIARSLSVRDTEALVKTLTSGSGAESGAASPEAAAKAPADVHTRVAEERLRLLYGTRVRIVRRGSRGRIEIDFGSEDELIRIYEQLADK